MALDRIMAALAFACLAVFLGIIFFKVMRLDLGIVILIGFALVIYDLATQLFPGTRRR
ncbi:MAG: hypothetical protein K5872_15710 [Rhizobiaceae bacterium]|nr:hypothetical protein [Rhizobiaceae bacterium]MCV0407670.1 hypothetical protein [Rhizobiaceae bacterium]